MTSPEQTTTLQSSFGSVLQLSPNECAEICEEIRKSGNLLVLAEQFKLSCQTIYRQFREDLSSGNGTAMIIQCLAQRGHVTLAFNGSGSKGCRENLEHERDVEFSYVTTTADEGSSGANNERSTVADTDLEEDHAIMHVGNEVSESKGCIGSDGMESIIFLMDCDAIEQASQSVRDHVCHYCGKTFTCKRKIIIHLQVCPKVGPCECTECREMCKVQGETSSSDRQCIDLTEQAHGCKECNQRSMKMTDVSVQTDQDLTQQRVSGETPVPPQTFFQIYRPYECKECGKRFRTNPSLRNHLVVHSTVRAYECKKCGKTFKHSKSLRRHFSHHLQPRPYKCKECGEAFRRKDKFKDHLLIHANEKPSGEALSSPKQDSGDDEEEDYDACESENEASGTDQNLSTAPKPNSNKQCMEMTQTVSSDTYGEEKYTSDENNSIVIGSAGSRNSSISDNSGGGSSSMDGSQSPTKAGQSGVEVVSPDYQPGTAPDDQPDISTRYFEIICVREQQAQKFNALFQDYEIRFNNIQPVGGFVQVMAVLQDTFQSVIDRLTQDISPTDRVCMTMESPSLSNQIQLPFLPVQEITVHKVLNEIEEVVQPHEEITLNDKFFINFVHVHMPVGEGKVESRRPVNITDRLKHMRCVIQIINKDELCCARAIVTAIAHVHRGSDRNWNSIRRGRQVQARRATELITQAGISPGPCGHRELNKLQAVLPSYCISVISDETGSVLYRGLDPSSAEHNIYLYYHDNHYDVITSMCAFLKRSYYCHQCNIGYNNYHGHYCRDFCNCCRASSVCPLSEDCVYCIDCHRYFRGQKCFENHKTKTPNSREAVCQAIRRCKFCGVTINWGRRSKHMQHHCGEIYCKDCQQYEDSDHLCNIQPPGKKLKIDSPAGNSKDDSKTQEENEEVNEKEMRCFYFSFVGTQDGGPQVPNVCIVQSASDPEQVFHGPNSIQEFCNWVLAEGNSPSTFIAHGLQGYDGHLIVQYCHDKNIRPQVIMNGKKIICIFIPNLDIKFIDFHNFLPVPLAQLPGMFELDDWHKGYTYFPHSFNTAANQGYVGPLPDARYFGQDGMKQHERERFLRWYEDAKLKNRPFHLKKELENCCRSDVDILRRSCVKFQDMFVQMSGIDPFKVCMTISSACNAALHKNSLMEETKGVIADQRYIHRQDSSVVTLQWLEWMAFKKKASIKHVHNSGKTKIDQYWVDGYDEENNTVYELHGCYDNGCPQCYKDPGTFNARVEKTMADLNLSAKDKMRFLRSHGFRVIEMWECDFKKEMEENHELQEFVTSLDVQVPLNPKDACYGSRTNATTLYYECGKDEQIHHVGFRNLYCRVMKYCKYPIKHPDILTKNIVSQVHTYFGLTKCRVLPPRQLYFPVLPLRVDKKLMFPLCRCCAETKQQSPCKHSDKERSFVGTWTTPELAKAIEKGYKVVKVFEVWHYKESEMYDRGTHTGGIFTDYVNAFLKLKEESSGWPSWCHSEDDCDRYIQDKYKREGILLDKTKICLNPGQQTLAKLMLNAMWGKFAQRNNFSEQRYIQKPKELFRLLTSEQNIVNNLTFINDHMVGVQDDFVGEVSNINAVIDAFTSAYARLKMYDVLETIGKRVLYCDTDSIIFISKPGDYEPPLGESLGDLASRFNFTDNYITKFVSVGPNNYAFCLAKPNRKGNSTVCQVGGITLQYPNNLEISSNDIACLVTSGPMSNYLDEIQHVGSDFVTNHKEKSCAVVYDKRILVENYRTLPYGF